MDKAWTEELANTLYTEKDILSRLSDITEAKTNVIIGGNIKELSDMLNEEQPLLMQLDHMENKRLCLIKSAGLQGKTLSQIAKDENVGSGKELSKILDSFSGIIKRLKTANGLNSKLIHSRLDFYKSMRGVDGENYSQSGITSDSQKAPSLMDQKV